MHRSIVDVVLVGAEPDIVFHEEPVTRYEPVFDELLENVLFHRFDFLVQQVILKFVDIIAVGSYRTAKSAAFLLVFPKMERINDFCFL
jgi:hypothetical protein